MMKARLFVYSFCSVEGRGESLCVYIERKFCCVSLIN